ncbi:chalcone synthase [Tanacetum coccineum]|uniref:chalcone synthase n=1 Tax=Tanacetum coccineum TaxID=301880 RepID=A0ABQ5HLD2_9ASTR
MFYQGCHAGGPTLRLAKGLAENNYGARVSVVFSELLTIVTFCGPDGIHIDNFAGQAMFGDGVAAVIVGSDPLLHFETILPDSEGVIEGHLHDTGITFQLLPKIPTLVSQHMKRAW